MNFAPSPEDIPAGLPANTVQRYALLLAARAAGSCLAGLRPRGVGQTPRIEAVAARRLISGEGEPERGNPGGVPRARARIK